MEDNSGDNECGRKKHPVNCTYTTGMFANIKTTDEFAILLGVPKKSIPLVVPTNKHCKSHGCPFNAIRRNGGHCPAHERRWYPLLDDRGGGLFGPEFLHDLSSTRYIDCSCSDLVCKSAGYFPNQSAIYIPKDGNDIVKNTPNLLSNETKQKDKLHIYPWHFFPEHLIKDKNGRWKLKYDTHIDESYYDLERQHPYSFPPPRNVPTKWINNVYLSGYVRPQERWAQTNTTTKMPDWMLNMLAIDQSSDDTNHQNNKKKISTVQ